MQKSKEYFFKFFSPISVGIVLFCLLHLFLLSKTFVVDNRGDIRTLVAGYGDIPYHMTEISKFAFSPIDNLNDPIFLGVKLRYPFLINFVSGMFLRLGASLHFSVLFPTFALAVFNIFLAYLIYKKLIGSRGFAYLALLFFFLGGGLGGFAFLSNVMHGQVPVREVVQKMIQNSDSTVTRGGAVYPDQNIDFGAPLTLVFMHQRTFFLGLFGFLLFFWCMLRLRDESKIGLYLGAILSFSILPFAHTHSFIAASFLYAVFFLAALFKKKWDLLKRYFLVGIIGFLVTLPQVIYIMGSEHLFSSTSSFLKIRLGWMVQPTIGSVLFPELAKPSLWSIPYLNFLWLNFGVILPIFLLACFYYFFRRKSFEQNSFVGISAIFAGIIFLLVETVQFQPWDYDNNKLLVYFQFFAAIIIFVCLKKVYENNKIFGIILAICFLVLSTFSGVIDIIPRAFTPDSDLPVIFSKEAIDVGAYIRKSVPEGDLIVTGTSHLNPINTLAGRGVLVGYPGWLWSHGINYGSREQEIKDFYANPGASDLVHKYNAKYVLLDYQSVLDYKANQAYFEAHFQKVFEEGQYTLFKL
ncbi:MAG: hypothetical protein PHV42_00345 [Candidatus Pacebacteria bacterium]|nr:hypothetical protein [Candidatus Paceibacterota bacterium]